MTTPSEEEARAVIEDARAWLDSHQHHHSARRTDVRRLIAALEAALASRVSTPPSEDWEYVGEDRTTRRFSDRPDVAAEWVRRGYAVRRRTKAVRAGAWEPVPAVPVLPTEPARMVRECVICGERVTVSNATKEWEGRHRHTAPTEPEGVTQYVRSRCSICDEVIEGDRHEATIFHEASIDWQPHECPPSDEEHPVPSDPKEEHHD